MTLREFFDWWEEKVEGIGAFIGEVFSLVFQQSPWMDASIWAVIVAILIYLAALNYCWSSLVYAYQYTVNAKFRKDEADREEEDKLYGEGKLSDENATRLGCGFVIVFIAVLWLLSLFGVF